MGLPSIDISFQTAAQATIAMGDKGYVGVIVRDTAQAGAHYLPRVGKIPAELTEDNRAYLTRTFLGYINPPKAVYLYVTDAEDTNLAGALAYFETQEVDYLVGPPDLSEDEAEAMVMWLKEVRAAHSHIKLVLPNTVAGRKLRGRRHDRRRNRVHDRRVLLAHCGRDCGHTVDNERDLRAAA